MLPPLGRPKWMPRDPAGAELLYLSWGVRWMGNHPIPLAMHDGWVYAVVVEGSLKLKLQNQEHATKSGDVFIFHPDCAFGWQDQPKRPSRLMTWLWRNPPTHSKLLPAPGGWSRVRVNDRQLRLLVGIHQQCQRDVGSVGETALLSLRRARLDLDINLADALNRQEPANQPARMNMALHFLRHNPGVKAPAKSLCDHLCLTPAGLRKLFRENCGRSLQSVALEMRMNYVRERLLKHETTVKALAAELGYSHANDLSRAYKKYFGAVTRAARPRAVGPN